MTHPTHREPDVEGLKELLARATPDTIQSCPDCGGHGEIFGHAADCIEDSCALNGDIDSCDGKVSDCHCWIAMRNAATNALPHLLDEITRLQSDLAEARGALIDLLNTSGARGAYHALEHADAVERAEKHLRRAASVHAKLGE